jgi:pimeloyl-ACP methyl ester carboxylesterase
MTTHFALAPDGIRIAYDKTGIGPPLLLLHGGGGNRHQWHTQGYVQRLQAQFTVVTMDIRGHGESDKPLEPTAYTSDRLTADVYAVADHAGIHQFALWGFSYGGNIGRYIATEATRLTKFVMMGIPFGQGASGAFRHRIEAFATKWKPTLDAYWSGAPIATIFSEQDYTYFRETNVPLTYAWLTAMLNWKAIEPLDLACPTLWLVGSENEAAAENVATHRDNLGGSFVQLHIVAGLNHQQEFDTIDQVLPPILAFTL